MKTIPAVLVLAGCLGSVTGVIAEPAFAQNAFAPSEAGKGRTCYFGECSDNSYDLGSPPNPAPQPAPRPPAQYQTRDTAPALPAAPVNYANELTNFGVQPQSYLQSQVGTQTPISIPGGRVVTTEQLKAALAVGKRYFLVIDALEDAHQTTIASAYHIAAAGRGGTFDDAVQQQVFSQLYQMTGGNVAYPLVFFCRGAQCWESYNAALRAIRMGFSNVYWYRGGISAWEEAGLPTVQVNW